jgi:hypothetical protein
MHKNNVNHLFGVLAALHKSPDWAYEHEWRFVLPVGDADLGREFPISAPTAIYLGSRISDEHKHTLIQIAKVKEIKVYEMSLSVSEFRLESNLIRIT